MRKLIQGIVEFRRNVQDEYREKFGFLASGQTPDALFIACSDSRVVPNTFASTDPGDLFVVRNVGNLVPECSDSTDANCDESEAAAIEFSLLNLNVSDIIICGHSECGAMQALMNDRNKVPARNLRSWLRHGDESLKRLNAGLILDPALSRHNQLSQINVLAQMDRVKTHPDVDERIKEGKLRVHGWWFDIKRADVYSYSEAKGKFILLDEQEAQVILQNIES